MKAKAIIGTVKICEFSKYVGGDRRLLVLRLSRKLSALPSVDSGATVRIRSSANKLEVFDGDKLAGSLDAPGLAAAVWAGFGGDPVKSNR